MILYSDFQGSHSEILEQVILKQRNDMHKVKSCSVSESKICSTWFVFMGSAYFHLIAVANILFCFYQSELERERLAMELEEERKARETLELRIKEQQKKIENLSSLSITSYNTSISTQVT